MHIRFIIFTRNFDMNLMTVKLFINLLCLLIIILNSSIMTLTIRTIKIIRQIVMNWYVLLPKIVVTFLTHLFVNVANHVYTSITLSTSNRMHLRAKQLQEAPRNYELRKSRHWYKKETDRCRCSSIVLLILHVP